jgi:transposase-like protein
MEEGCQKSKRLSYTAKFKREVIRCAEEKGNRKAAAIFGVDESNVRLWRKHKTGITGCEASRRKLEKSEVACWVSAAWKAIPESIFVRSFKKCCVSNAMDGSEDDIVWEEDFEDKDDSDWVESTDNDPGTSDAGESDE